MFPRIPYTLAAQLFLVAVGLAASTAARQALAGEPPPFHIQAHRGAGIGMPENTLESFQWAWNHGVTPEADLRTTKDGNIVCFHDPDLKRVVSNVDDAHCTSAIEQLTTAEVDKLEVGSFRGKKYSGQHVAKLADVFAAMRGHPDRLLYLDIKTVDLDRLAALVRQHEVTSQGIFTTTKYPLIKDWKSRAPDSPTLLWNGGSEAELEKKMATVRKADFAGITYLQIHVQVGDLDGEEPFMPSSTFLKSLGTELKSRGVNFQVLPWECSDQRAYDKLLNLGAASFATDYPQVALAAVKAAHLPLRNAAAE